MASTTEPTPTVTEEIVTKMGTFLRIFSDGTIERPSQSPFVPPTLLTGLSSKDIIISQNPPISARIYLPILTTTPQHHKVPIFIYFHGGAFVFESAFSQIYHNHLSTFATQANVLVVSVEYRLAPEHPLPACYDDCWTSLQWVSSHFGKNPTKTEQWLIEHGDFDRIFIGGDSAGANIAHNIAIRAGNEDLPNKVKIFGAILTHPYFYSSYPVGSEQVIDPEQNISIKVWNLVYPSAEGGIDNPSVNPLGPGAPDLAALGCSRMIVCVAENDMFRDRGIWYYEGVKKSGWKGKLELFEEKGEGHVYHLLQPETENASKLIKRLVSFFHED